MKFAPVVPPALINQLKDVPDVGYFAFAPWLMKHGDYYDFFRDRDRDMPLTVDCPIYEGEEPLEPYMLKQIEAVYEPDFIIVPDVRHDMKATLRKFESYMSLLNGSATGVLQGQTYDELAKCAKEMSLATRKFAIPKDVYGMFGLPRYEVLMKLFLEGWLPENCEIHLLGGIWPYTDERKCSNIPQVKMFDCAEPFNAAYYGRSLFTEPPARPSDFLAIKRPVSQRMFSRNVDRVVRWSR